MFDDPLKTPFHDPFAKRPVSMTTLFPFLAAPPSVPQPGPRPSWWGVAARPGSGLGLLPAALSAQPVATLAALLLGVLAAAVAPR